MKKNKLLSLFLISVFSLPTASFIYASSNEEVIDEINYSLSSRSGQSRITDPSIQVVHYITDPELALKNEALKYFERSSLKPEVVFKLREEQLDFIKDNEELKEVHSRLSEKLAKCFISYKETDPTIHAAHLLISSLSSASVLLFSGVSTFHKEDKTTPDYLLGTAQVLTAALSASIAHIVYPRIANWYHSREKKSKKFPAGERIKLLPFYYSNEQITTQSEFIALYILALNKNSVLDQWNNEKRVNQFVKKVGKSFIDFMDQSYYSIIHYLPKIDNEDLKI